MSSSAPPPFQAVQALVFDLMGTCTDWRSSILSLLTSLPVLSQLTPSDLPKLADDWRAGFFAYILASFARGEESPAIDEVHREVLDGLLRERGVSMGDGGWGEDERSALVQGWHRQLPWSDAVEGLTRLKKRFMVVVLANGTTRLQLDIIRSSGLPFDALFSSQLLGCTKPSPEMYLKALDLLALKPEQTLMVAAHAYDLRAAAKVGMKTAYIRRTTEDPQEDMGQVSKDVDLFIDGTVEGNGLLALAQHMAV